MSNAATIELILYIIGWLLAFWLGHLYCERTYEERDKKIKKGLDILKKMLDEESEMLTKMIQKSEKDAKH